VAELNKTLQIVGLAGALALLASLSFVAKSVAQDTQGSREERASGQELSGQLAAAKNVRVKVDMGSVVIQGGQQQGINYSVHTRSDHYSEQDTRRQDKYRITTYVRGDTAWIVGEWQGGHVRHFSGQFSISVPRETALVKVESGGGGLEVSGISGRAELATGGGKIRVGDVGSVNAETGGDAIEVGSVAGDANLQTGGGNITVGNVKGKVIAGTGAGSIRIDSCGQGATVETGGSNVQIRQCAGGVKVSTGGGNVDLSDIAGPVDIETGGGSIHLNGAKGHVVAQTGGGVIELYGVPSARAETGAGGITLKLVPGSERHDSDIETGTGDITVYIAPDVAINIRATVDMGNGHRIISDFPDIHVSSEGEGWGPKTLTADGKLNGGGPTLKVHTSTGDICLKKAR